MNHLRTSTVHPVSQHRTEFVLWTTDQASRDEFDTGCATLHVYPTAAECRGLAANLLRMADRVEAQS
jgi:hypothetical protein